MAKQWLKPGDGLRVILPGGRQVAAAGEEIEVDLFVLRRLACGDLVPATPRAAPAVQPAEETVR
jgi:hypothetical protein